MDAVLLDFLIPHVKESEGFYSQVYLCPADKRTIGYGHNLDARPITAEQAVRLGIPLGVIGHPERVTLTEEQAEGLMRDELEEVYQALKSRGALSGVDPSRQAVLIDMGFNIGVPGLMRFHRMWAAIKERRFDDAADEMIDSAWWHQVGRRSKKLVEIMRSGVWYHGYRKA